MIACSCSAPRLHAQPPRETSRKGWSPIVRMTLDPGRGIAAQPRVELAPAAAVGGEGKAGGRLDLALGGDPHRPASASQASPRSIAAQPPPAWITTPRASAAGDAARIDIAIAARMDPMTTG